MDMDMNNPTHKLHLGLIVATIFGTLGIFVLIAIEAEATEPYDRLSLSEPIVLGELDKTTDLQPVIEDNLELIQDCYRPAEESGDLLPYGRVAIKFVINSSGQVSSAKINSSSLNEPLVEACLCVVFRQMMFPRPQNGGIVIVTQDIAVGERPQQDLLSGLPRSLNGPPQGSGRRYELLPRESDSYLDALDQEVEDTAKEVELAEEFFQNMALLDADDPNKTSLLTTAYADLQEAEKRHEAATKARDAYLDQVGNRIIYPFD